VMCVYPAASTVRDSTRSSTVRTSMGSSAATNISNDPEASTESDAFHFDWDPMSIELMHNYSTATCFSLGDDPTLQTFYQVDVPKIGFSYPHVLHLLLGLSAMHMSRFRPQKQSLYLEHAERHSQAGFQLASRLLPNINKENCHSLFLFASLCCSFNMAMGPRPGSFLLFDDDRPAAWLSLFRGIKTVLDMHMEDIRNGILSAMIQAGISEANQDGRVLSSRESDQLARLRVMIHSTSASDEDAHALNGAVENLYWLFSSRVGSDGRTVSVKFRGFGIWLYRCTDEFMTLLQNRHPAALVIFAYACVPLNDVRWHWSMAGWIPHLLTGIWERLPREYHTWIQWPIQQIGWLPPE
jgi:hypothetical protein